MSGCRTLSRNSLGGKSNYNKNVLFPLSLYPVRLPFSKYYFLSWKMVRKHVRSLSENHKPNWTECIALSLQFLYNFLHFIFLIYKQENHSKEF